MIKISLKKERTGLLLNVEEFRELQKNYYEKHNKKLEEDYLICGDNFELIMLDINFDSLDVIKLAPYKNEKGEWETSYNDIYDTSFALFSDEEITLEKCWTGKNPYPTYENLLNEFN